MTGEIVGQSLGFPKQNRKYWLAPIIIVLVLVRPLLVVTQGLVVSPSIYTFL